MAHTAKHAQPVVTHRYAPEGQIGRLVRTVRRYLNERKGFYPVHFAWKGSDMSFLDFPANWRNLPWTVGEHLKTDKMDFPSI